MHRCRIGSKLYLQLTEGQSSLLGLLCLKNVLRSRCLLTGATRSLQGPSGLEIPVVAQPAYRKIQANALVRNDEHS